MPVLLRRIESVFLGPDIPLFRDKLSRIESAPTTGQLIGLVDGDVPRQTLSD